MVKVICDLPKNVAIEYLCVQQVVLGVMLFIFGYNVIPFFILESI